MASRSAVLAVSVTCKGFLHKHAAVEATFVTGSAPSLRAAAVRPASLWSLGRGRRAVDLARSRRAATGASVEAPTSLPNRRSGTREDDRLAALGRAYRHAVESH